MSIQKNLITLCFAAVFTLGLAACGGGGDGDAPVTGSAEGEPAAPIVAEPAAPTVAELFATAQDSRDASSAAAETAEGAVKAAMDASLKLMTLAVKGDSMTATTNAQAVLEMQAATVKAATDAETALQEAKDALEVAKETAADNASLMAALNAAIKAAEADVKMATDDRDGDMLKEAVAKVTGTDEDKPMSPADHGKVAAMDVGGALMPLSEMDGGRNSRAIRSPTADAPAGNKTLVKMSDQLGHTWAQIVGADKLSPKPLGEERITVMVASVAGMTAATVIPNDNTPTEGGDDGMEFTGSNYNGIEGTVYCLGSDCKVTDGKLAGSWYFTPNSPSGYYRKGMDMTYTEETAYAQFGHWLTVPEGGGPIVVNTYALTGHEGTTPAWTVNMAENATTLLDKSAKYSGDAVGMSVYKTFKTDGSVDGIYSGAFEADVNLTATFGAAGAQMLGGKVDNFQGNAVDSTWTVTFERTAVAAGAVEAGLSSATGRNGEWSATSYGDDDARPTGIFGDFNAHFKNGHAAGAYATRK